VIKLVDRTGWDFNGYRRRWSKGVTHWTPGDRIGSKWNNCRRSKLDFPQVKRGKSCSQFVNTLTQPARRVKPDFCAVFNWPGAIT
jgi:hypothetical protein